MDVSLPMIESFRVKAVEPIRMSTRAEREAALERAHFNLFRVFNRGESLRSSLIQIEIDMSD